MSSKQERSNWIRKTLTRAVLIGFCAGFLVAFYFAISTHLDPSVDNDPGIFWAVSPILFFVPFVAISLLAYVVITIVLLWSEHRK